jgi:hypothetical protein
LKPDTTGGACQPSVDNKFKKNSSLFFLWALMHLSLLAFPRLVWLQHLPLKIPNHRFEVVRARRLEVVEMPVVAAVREVGRCAAAVAAVHIGVAAVPADFFERTCLAFAMTVHNEQTAKPADLVEGKMVGPAACFVAVASEIPAVPQPEVVVEVALAAAGMVPVVVEMTLAAVEMTLAAVGMVLAAVEMALVAVEMALVAVRTAPAAALSAAGK